MKCYWMSITLVCSMIASLSAQTGGSSGIRANALTLKDGTQIHFLQAGRSSSASALVFIPGWTLPAFLWKEQIQKFSTERLVIAVDPRSQGDSSKTELGNTPEQRAQDIREILSMLRISNVVLVGWSQGSQDVAAYIQQFGTSSLAGAVFVDSPVSAGPSEIEINKEYSQHFLGMLAIYANHPGEYCEGMVRSMFKKPHPELNLAEVVEHSRKTPVSTGITMLIMDIFAVDRRPALARLDKPTLVIAATGSPLLEAQKRMAASIPGSQFVPIEDAGHAVFVDQPQAFDEALERLLKSILSTTDSTRSNSTRIPTNVAERLGSGIQGAPICARSKMSCY